MPKLILVLLFVLTIPFQALATDCDVLCEKMKALDEKTLLRFEKVDLRFEMQDKALCVAKETMDDRLEITNGLRDQLNRQADTFMPATEIKQTVLRIDEAMGRLVERIRHLESMRNESTGSDKWLNHIVTVLIMLAGLFLMSVISRKNGKVK